MSFQRAQSLNICPYTLRLIEVLALGSVLLTAHGTGISQCTKVQPNGGAVGVTGGQVYLDLGTEVRVSADQGKTWTTPADLNNLLKGVSSGSTLNVADGQVFFRSCTSSPVSFFTFQGVQGAWQQVKVPAPCNAYFAASGSTWLFCPGQSVSCTVTKDYGKSWSQLQIPSTPHQQLAMLSFYSTAGAILLLQPQAGTGVTFIDRLDPNSLTWSDVTPFQAYFMPPPSDGTFDSPIFVAPYGKPAGTYSKLAISSDGGISWSFVDNPVANDNYLRSMNGIIFWPSYPNILYTRDLGKTWRTRQSATHSFIGAGGDAVFFTGSPADPPLGLYSCPLP